MLELFSARSGKKRIKRRGKQVSKIIFERWINGKRVAHEMLTNEEYQVRKSEIIGTTTVIDFIKGEK